MPRISKPRPGEPIKMVTLKDGSVRYRATATTSPRGAAKRTQAKRSFATLKEARAWVTETHVAVAAGKFTRRSGLTLDQAADRWLAAREGDVLSGAIRPVTLQGYVGWLAAVRRWGGDRRVSSLRPSDIEQFRTWCLSPGANARATRTPRALSNRATACAIARLQDVLDMAVRDGVIPNNPARGIRRPPSGNAAGPRSDQVWTLGQVGQFIEQVDVERQAGRLSLPLAVALRLASCAMRRSEVAGLCWSAVDLEGGRVAVVSGRVVLSDGSADRLTGPKSARSRRWVEVEALSPGITSQLKALWLAAGRPAAGLAVGEGVDGSGAPVLPSSADMGALVVASGGVPVKPQAISACFRSVSRDAGLPVVKMHHTRHALASALAADAEIPDVDAAALLGDTVEVFHSAYVASRDDGRARAASRLGALMSAQRVAPVGVVPDGGQGQTA